MFAKKDLKTYVVRVAGKGSWCIDEFYDGHYVSPIAYWFKTQIEAEVLLCQCALREGFELVLSERNISDYFWRTSPYVPEAWYSAVALCLSSSGSDRLAQLRLKTVPTFVPHKP